MKISLNDPLGVVLYTALTDAERCLQIYASAEAKARPMMAWMMLPYGQVPKVTINRLAELETERGQDKFYRTHLGLLTQRRNDARELCLNHFTRKDQKPHVH